MTVQFPPLAPSLPGDLPTPADAIRAAHAANIQA